MNSKRLGVGITALAIVLGCATSDLPREARLVGGGLKIEYRAPADGTAILIERTPRGIIAIDGTIAREGKRHVLVIKDETFFPERRNLRVAFADKATGPYGPAAPTFTDLHTEGPSILHTGGWWYVYCDEDTRGHYGAVRTKDFLKFEPYRDSLITPRGIRHGSAFLAPASVLRGLLALDSIAR